MSDGKRRRTRKIKQQDDKRPIILAKRTTEDEPTTSRQRGDADMQPKILLKSRAEKENKENEDDIPEVSASAPLKTIIVTRSETAHSPGLSGPSPNITKEQQQPSSANVANEPNAPATILVEPVPQMTRPATIISSTGVINANARKMLMKANTDFLVVGIIGTQGVGKSTIMNLLAYEEANYDFYNKVFVEKECIFPIKFKPQKCSARSRTESTHMFITSDRLILLDSPPVLCNSYRKDMTTNELDDLRQIITFMSVCHLLIVVLDDYFNIHFLRLLQFAEIMKPTHDNKTLMNDYFPNVLFVKNRAKRYDYVDQQQERMRRMVRALFKDSQLRIFVGQTAEQQRQKKTRAQDMDRTINILMLPEVDELYKTSTFHKPLRTAIEELRANVFMTPRNEMYEGTTELSEAIWYELLTTVVQDTQNFFFNTYEEIQRKHLEMGNGGSSGGINNLNSSMLKEPPLENWRESMHENWREQ